MGLLLYIAQHGASAGGERSLVIDLLLLLAAAGLVTMLLRRLGMSTIPGYLITGAIIGPGTLALITSDENISQMSELAILLLMFTIGMHLDMDAIRTGMVSIIAVGVVSSVLVMAAIWGVSALWVSAPAALAVGMAFAMSSTAVVLGILQTRREVNRVHGRLCIGIAIVQDLLSVVVLALLPLLAVWAGGSPGGVAEKVILTEDLGKVSRLFIAAGFAIGGIAVMLAFGRYVLPRLLKEAARGGGAGGSEELLVVSAAVALGAAVLTTVTGIGPALGSFLAGFMLTSTSFKHQLAGQLSPLRSLFMAVFFTVVGLQMDFSVILGHWWLVGIGLVALMGIKTLVIAFCCWAGGATAPVSLLTGALLSQAGEFSLIVLAAAGTKGIIPDDVAPTLIAVVVLSLIATPMVHTLALRLIPRLARIQPAPWINSVALREPGERLRAKAADAAAAEDTAPSAETPAPVRHGHIIVAGFGIVGRAVADRFEVDGIPYIVVELNPKTVARQTSLGRSIVYGDISNPEVLESAGIDRADAVVLTIPDDDAVLRACQSIRAAKPDIFIAVRTSYLSSAFAATGVGADEVTVAEVATAEAMARQVLRKLTERRALPAATGPVG
ncbi:MAG: cation:proton antiporter [Phycisphaeraceae bacterium]|nr:cation:proton antiporter [Phycisphaeraceae bacterium]